MFLLLCRFAGAPLAPYAENRYAEQSFSYYFLSVVDGLRMQLHTSWLFAGLFGALGLAGLMWVMAEKWQQGSEWNRHDAIWMAGFEGSLLCGAVLYRIGTNGVLARKFAISGGIADVLGLGLALAVPVVLWLQWQRPNQKASEQDEDDDSVPSAHFSRTILGLQDYSPASPINRVSKSEESIAAVAPAAVQPPINQPAEWLQRSFHKQNEPAKEQTRSETTAMENMNILNLDAQPVTTQPETARVPLRTTQAVTPQTPAVERLMHQTYSAPPVAAQPIAPQPVSAQPVMSPTMPQEAPAPTQERATIPAATFREQLFALNASWQRIEATGKEVEDWFQRQQKLVMAHLERPAAKSRDSHVELSRDFLEQRMDKVDAEWAAIHQTVREIHRWLENGIAESPQETKVW